MANLISQFESTPSLPGTFKFPTRTAGNLGFSNFFARPARWDVATVVTRSLLDRVNEQINGSPSEVELGMTELLSVLYSLKSSSSSEVWTKIGAQCIAHPLSRRIHEDPFASRCFKKPRGYAGDAVLIDYLYTRDCHLDPSQRVTALGERIFDFTRDIPAGRAVRRRRDLMGAVIDEVCDSTDKPRILSVACGHLREASLSDGVRNNRVERFVALDQDEMSLQTVKRELGGLGVTTVCDSIKALFRGPVAEEKFDLVYSTGLYDYLDDRLATKLTKRMFEMLNPGGRLVIANFVPNIWCTAYMEALLDWKLIYRNVEQMNAIASGIPTEQVAATRIFVEENENICFLDMSRR